MRFGIKTLDDFDVKGKTVLTQKIFVSAGDTKVINL